MYIKTIQTRVLLLKNSIKIKFAFINHFKIKNKKPTII